MKVRFILSFLAALFIAGNMIAIESTDRVERKLPIVLRGEVPTTTSRSVPVIPIDASISTENNTVDIIFQYCFGRSENTGGWTSTGSLSGNGSWTNNFFLYRRMGSGRL